MPFWDGIIGVAQFKSLVQLIAGDVDGARQTQENFLNQAPMISQYKSLYHLIDGNEEAARETQEIFLNNTITPMVESTPVVGHIKGAVHIALGEEERGVEIIKGATTSTAMAVGGIIAGPAGAIGAGIASDALITGIDSALDGEYKPFGLVDYASNIDHLSVGEHFDTVTGLIVAGAGSSTKVRNAFKGYRPKIEGRVHSKGVAGREIAKYGANEGAPIREYIAQQEKKMAAGRKSAREAAQLARQFEGW